MQQGREIGQVRARLAQLLQQLQDQQQKTELRDKTCLDFYTADLVAS